MILTHLKFLKLFSWTFLFIFEFFLSLSVSQKFLTHKRMKKNRKNSQKSTFSAKFSKINKCWIFSKIPIQFFDFTSKVSLVWFWYLRRFLMILWKFEKVFFLPKKKTIFFKKSIFFSKTSIMEDLYIDVETWILHQFRRLYPQNFRFYTYFLNFIKKIDFVCFPDFHGIIYIHNIQKMMSYMHIAKYSRETDKLKFFL